MSAPIDHCSIQTSRTDDLFQLATLWRGAMLNRFCRVELEIVRCLEALHGSGRKLHPGHSDPAPKTRYRSLIGLLKSGELVGHGQATLKHVKKLEPLFECRNALAHGTIEIAEGNVSFRWHAKGDVGLASKSLLVTPAQMLEQIVTLDKLVRDISSQLGQLRKQSTPTEQMP